MNILLINVKNPYVDSNNPPLGLGYLSSYLKAHTDDDIRAVDFTVDKLSFKEFSRRYLHDFQPELIGITIVTPTYVYAVDLAKKIKKEIDTHISVGGPHPSALPEETTLESCFDSVVAGEGEIAFLKLRNSLGEPRANKIIIGEKVKDINSLPFPDRSIFPIDKYKFTIDGVKATSIITSRACPFNCVYCDKSVFGNKVSQRSPENVIAEIEILIKDFGVRGFNFLDDTFTLKKNFTGAFCDLIKQKKLDIIWKCMTRVDRIDEQLLTKMKDSGCVELVIGVESGNEGILKKIKKGITKTQVIQCIAWAKKLGLRTKTFFMIGFPWDTEETIKETINFAIELDPDASQFGVVTPFPKTELCKILEELDIQVSTDWRDYLLKGDEINYAYTLPHLPKEALKKYVEVAYKAFEKRERLF